LHTDIHKTEKFNGVFKSCICESELQSYNRWLVSAYSPPTLLIKSLHRTVQKKFTLQLNSLKMASVHAKTCHSGYQCVILYTWCSVQELVNKVVFWYFKLITCLKNTTLWDMHWSLSPSQHKCRTQKVNLSLCMTWKHMG